MPVIGRAARHQLVQTLAWENSHGCSNTQLARERQNKYSKALKLASNLLRAALQPFAGWPAKKGEVPRAEKQVKAQLLSKAQLTCK